MNFYGRNPIQILTSEPTLTSIRVCFKKIPETWLTLITSTSTNIFLTMTLSRCQWIISTLTSTTVDNSFRVTFTSWTRGNDSISLISLYAKIFAYLDKRMGHPFVLEHFDKRMVYTVHNGHPSYCVDSLHKLLHLHYPNECIPSRRSDTLLHDCGNYILKRKKFGKSMVNDYF